MVLYVVGERSPGSEAIRKRVVDPVEVIMPERVAIKQVRILLAENLRVPGQGKSAQG